jgi:hypothetical protein
MFKFVLTHDGYLFILNGGYHMDTGVPSKMVRSAGYLNIESEEPMQVSLSRNSEGYGIGVCPGDQDRVNKWLKDNNYVYDELEYSFLRGTRIIHISMGIEFK